MSDLALYDRPLPIGSVGRRGLGWWGVLCVIATEAALFAYLLFAYFYYAVQIADHWIPVLPSFSYSLPGIVALIVSGAGAWWGERGTRRNSRLHALIGFLAALVLGCVFLALQVLDWIHEPFTLRSGEYGSVFFTITGFHVAHLIAGLVILLLILIWSALGYFDARRNTPVLVAAAYWYFVVAVGVVVFVALYVLPYWW